MVAGEHFLDKLFCKFMGSQQVESSEYFDPPPTHGQILRLIEEGDILREEGLAQTSIPQALYLGQKDPFVSKKIAATLSEQAGHSVIIANDAQHNAFVEDPNKVRLKLMLNGDFAAAQELTSPKPQRRWRLPFTGGGAETQEAQAVAPVPAHG